MLNKGDIVENMRGENPVVKWKNVGWWTLRDNL